MKYEKTRAWSWKRNVITIDAATVVGVSYYGNELRRCTIKCGEYRQMQKTEASVYD